MFRPRFQKKIKDQVMVITGATSGIGLATSRLAAQQGAKVVLAARNEQALKNICTEICSQGGVAVYQVADVANHDEVKQISQKAIDSFGGFDTWVNNAGVTLFGELQEIEIQDHRRLMEVNFWGVVHGTLEAVKHLKHKGGTIINIGSVLSERSIPLQGAFAASKFAVKSFTDTLRMELEKDNAKVTVTLLVQSSIATPFAEHARNYMPEKPKLIGPYYHPRVSARAILKCSQKKYRDVIVGGAGIPILLVGRHTPRLGDLFLRNRAYRLQKIPETKAESTEGNLFKPCDPEGNERGDQTQHVCTSSFYTKVHLHPYITALTLLGATGLIYWLSHRDPLKQTSSLNS